MRIDMTLRAVRRTGDILASGMALLGDEQIDQHLQGSQWRRDGGQIVREWKLADFAAAIERVNRVAELAEAANHHPDILIHGWNKLQLTLSTHSDGGLTEADFALAAQIDALG
ncbi:MAG TPA: 4a-hydroxytetrahydrobiopterin dehydratase [Solirubrobacteraceae bacterium]|jgi:4a-hydroxytetrahydrobiopterin dehydratase